MDRRGVGRVGSDAEEPNAAVAVSKFYLPDGLGMVVFSARVPLTLLSRYGFKRQNGDLPGGPVTKTACFQHRGHRFKP